jgi:hypothetical protein
MESFLALITDDKEVVPNLKCWLLPESASASRTPADELKTCDTIPLR